MKEKIFRDSMKRFITSGLFHETAQQKDYVIYTLDEARALYVDCNDPTGYQFANLYLGGYKHWLALKESQALAHHILQWEDELEVKLRSEALVRIHTHSKGKDGYQASKYLAEAGWSKQGVGRPSKAQIEKEAKLRSRTYDEFNLQVVK
jgi:hypothetical protein